MNIKVDFTLRAVIRKGSVPRYDLNVILKDINADLKVFAKNFSNIELTPTRTLDLGDYQLICNERGLGDLIQNSVSNLQIVIFENEDRKQNIENCTYIYL